MVALRDANRQLLGRRRAGALLLHSRARARGLVGRTSCLLLAAGAVLAAAAAAAPVDGPVDVTCELVWEAPGLTDAYVLGGLLVDAAWDRDGNLCVVDYRNKDLKLFAPDGRYLRTLGRAGEGPGESRDARRLLQDAGGLLGLLQVFPANIVWLQPDGSPGGRTAVRNTLDEQGGFVAVPHAVQHAESILVYATMMAMAAGRVSERHWIAPLAADGALAAPLYTSKVEQPARDAQNRVDEGDYYDLWAARWAPDGRGGVWLAPHRDVYRLVRHDETGAVVATIDRPYDPVRRDDLGRHQALEHLGRKRLAAAEIKLRDHAPVVRSLRLSDGGLLWVDLDLGGRGPAPGCIARIDVFDPDGRWLRQYLLHGPYDPETDQWRFVDDEHLLVLHAGGEDEVSLRLLRWRPPGD